MRVVDGGTIFSPSDLVAFAACRHLTELERAAAAGLVAKPIFTDPAFDLLRERGDEHEARYLADLEAAAALDAAVTPDASVDVPRAPTSKDGPRRVTRIKVDRSQGPAGEEAAARATEQAMKRGDAVIHQATFVATEGSARWVGHADFLIRVKARSALGDWSYEPADAKLARAAKAGAVLQLCAYAEMLARLQGRAPTFIRLILGGPGHPEELLRLSDYDAYYRWTKAEFVAATVGGGHGDGGDAKPNPPQYPPTATYPEPVEKCDTCNWSTACDKRRHADDHLSLVAGITRNQRVALDGMGVTTMTQLAQVPIPLAKAPPRTSADALARAREQARLQVESDAAHTIKYDLLPELTPDLGLGALPPPSPGDLFFDIEGDPFAFDAGIEYLFGIAEPGRPDPTGATNAPTAHAFWAHDARTEKQAFEAVIDFFTAARARDPNLHVFHYNHYEPTALRRLMSRYGTREAEVDSLLRDGVLVDLYRVVTQGVRAGVESYSIKKLEPLYGFTREAELRDAGAARAAMEIWIEMGAAAPLDAAVRDKVRVYNLDDCLSTWKLRDWLEERRADLAAQEGQVVPRPTPRDTSELDDVLEKDAAVAALANKLRDAGGPDGPAAALLGNLLDYHRREEKSAWWEFFDLCDKTDAQLIENKTCLGGLKFVERRDPPPLGLSRSYHYTYDFPEQEHDLEEGDSLFAPRSPGKTTNQTSAAAPGTAPLVNRSKSKPRKPTGAAPTDENAKDKKTSAKQPVGKVFKIDEVNRRLIVKRGISQGPPPEITAVVPRDHIPSKSLLESLIRVGESVVTHGIDGDGPHRAARDLLLRKAPRLRIRGDQNVPTPGEAKPARRGEGTLLHPGETLGPAAVRLVGALHAGVLPIQGPPGSGKTYSGAEMALALVQAGHRVGVTANSHKVICNFLSRMCELGAEADRTLDIVQGGEGDDVLRHDWVRSMKNPDVPKALQEAMANANANANAKAKAKTTEQAHVIAGTAWLWARADMAGTVETLFIDEASQFSLANGVAASPAARSLVLLGDPQQLEQPVKGMHPPGAGASVLGHVLGKQKTIAPHQGLFLDKTRRLHPNICSFTSELFYEGKLSWFDGLDQQNLRSGASAAGLDGTGLRVVTVVHAGNQNESPEEVAKIRDIFDALVSGGQWTNSEGQEEDITIDDVLVIAPYNAQVAALKAALPADARVGTVDKFQGQEAPVVIYSMATSTPDEAPRGLPFLYSPNRLNVATSRARCLAIVVASPDLFRVPCRTPAQMKLANAFCRLREVGRGPGRSPF